MKKIAALLSLLVLCGGYNACFAKEERTVVTFWQLSVKEDVMRSMIKEFEKDNPDIKVDVQILAWDFGFDKIVTSIAAGNAPDLCELGSTWVPTFATGGALADVTGSLSGIKDKYIFWEPLTYQERLFGAPWLVGTRALFYNKDLFRKAGLDPETPPGTWAELLEYSRKIEALGGGVHGFGIYVGEPYTPWQLFLPFAWSNGAEVLSPDFKKPLIDSPEFMEALYFYDLLKKYSVKDRQAQVNQAFAEGKVGMQISGEWNLMLIPQNNPGLDYGVALVPRPYIGKGEPVSFAGGEVLVIFKQSKHQQQAEKLMKFLIREDNIMKVVKSQKNVLPSSKESIKDPYFREQHKQRVFFEQMLAARAAPGHPAWQKIEEDLTRAIEEVVLLNAEPKAAIDKAAARITKVLAVKKSKAALSDRAVYSLFAAVIFLIAAAGYIWQRLKGAAGPRKEKFRFKKAAGAYLFISPWLVIFTVFGLFPLIHSVIISFSDYNLIESSFSFVGLANYFNVLADPNFHKALWHTIFFAVGTVPFTTAIALFCALLINRKVPFKQLYQAGLFLPVVTSVIVIASIFSYIYSPDGLLNSFIDKLRIPAGGGSYLQLLHRPEPSWLLNTALALPCIMAMCVWSSFGYYTILFLAGLQSISSETYEASSIDGATWWGQFRYIILPQLKPIMLFIVVINSIRSFQVFPEVFAMTQGGPLGSTTTVVYYLYELGFHKFDMGTASAVGYILFLFIMGFTLIQLKIFKFGESVG
ncbi:MAG: extracellular solute-binding protein [Candidatus Omnitrophica bacterium]|nr:extracellular solute-binding protein [Candidatus Omnitrophota bacterium]